MKKTRMSLNDFHEANGGRYVTNDKPYLPTQSSGKTREEIFAERDARREARRRDQEDRFSRADEAGQWRRAGGSSRRDDGPRYGRSDDQDRWRSGGRSSYGGSRYGDRDGGYGGGDRYGRRDDRFSSFSRRGDDRDSGYDSRPSHLRRFRRGDSASSSSTMTSSGSGDVRRQGTSRFEELADETVGLTIADKKQSSKKRAPREQRNLADNLKDNVVDITKQGSALKQAMDQKDTVDAAKLEGNLEALDLSDADVLESLSLVLAKSIIKATLTGDELAAAMQSDLTDAQVSQVLESMCLKIKSLEGNTALVKMVSGTQADLASLVSGGKTGDDLDAFLREKDMMDLLPVPNVTDDVMASLKAGDAPEKTLKVVTDGVDAKLSVSYLCEPVTAFVMDKVLADAKNPDLDVVAAYGPLLQRAAARDVEAQIDLIFQVSTAWAKAGKVGATCKKIFMAFHEAGVISGEAFVAWKESTRKDKNKMQVLLKLSMWVTEIAPKPVVEEYDEDEDEDEDIDAQLAREFY